jgi:hypothetical protein
MRGKIIHYNANDGRGLIAADGGQQYPFEVAQWRSDVAPAVNQTVEFGIADGGLAQVERVGEDVLLKEKASALAGKFGTAGDAALRSLKSNAPAAGLPSGLLSSLGKPLVAGYALFAVAALFLPYLGIDVPYGGEKTFSLVGLSQLSESLGSSVGGAFWPWLGILSVTLPLFWKSRWAWVALLLPLLASVKPMIDIILAMNEMAKGMGGLNGFGGQIADQLLNSLHIGFGSVLCVAASLFIAAIGLKRVVFPPTAAK